MHSLFPIHLRALETPHYTSSPHEYRDSFTQAFLSGRAPGQHYYAYDVIIHSRTKVEYVAFDMRCGVWGGIGPEIWRKVVEVPRMLTATTIKAAAHRATKLRRAEELIASEERIVAAYASEILEAVDASHA